MKPIRKLAADANVILSAVAGKAALRVFAAEGVEIATTQFNIEEVNEYLGIISEKYGLERELLESQLRLLALKVYERDFYEDFIGRASGRLAGRDEEDVELLALAMRLKAPVWSNDRDFAGAGVEVFTTARLLKALKV